MKAIIFCLLLPLAVMAQDSTRVTAPVRTPATLKIAPLNLLNPIQLSVDLVGEFPFANRWAAELGVDWIVGSPSVARYESERYQGIGLKPAIKRYFNRTASQNTYIALVFKYKNIYHDRFNNVIRQGGQYSEWLLLRKHRVTWGAAFRIGGQSYLGKQKRVVFETSMAFGIRQINVSKYNLPDDAGSIEGRRIFNFDRPPGIYTTADLMFGMAIGWVLNRRN